MTAVFLLALAAAAAGQSTTPGVTAAPADIGAALAKQGMTPAGVATVRRLEPQARASMQSFATRGAAVDAEVRAAAQANDVDRFARASQERDALVARFAADRTAATVGLLRALSAADRQLMFRAVTAGRR